MGSAFSFGIGESCFFFSFLSCFFPPLHSALFFPLSFPFLSFCFTGLVVCYGRKMPVGRSRLSMSSQWGGNSWDPRALRVAAFWECGTAVVFFLELWQKSSQIVGGSIEVAKVALR